MAAKKTTRVKRGATEITQSGLDALSLATAHAEKLDPRLPPGLRDGLARDLADFGVVLPGVLQAKFEQKAATVEQNQAAARAKDLVMAIRNAVAVAELPKDARKGWGLGLDVRPKVVKSVLTAGDTILARGAARPDEARAAGVLAADLERLRAALEATRGSDSAQENRKKTAKSATAARNELVVRTSAATAKISVAGVLEFTGSKPELASKFAALVPAKTRRRPAGGGEPTS